MTKYKGKDKLEYILEIIVKKLFEIENIYDLMKESLS